MRARAHVPAAVRDHHSQGNVICDLEETELPPADLPVASSIHSAFPQLLKKPACSI